MAKEAKFFVGKGNNGILIKNILKNRWWLKMCDNNDSSI